MTGRVRLKMCGMTRREDIDAAVSLGVDAIGLIFHPESPRAVSIEDAEALLDNLPPFASVVAVLVNPLAAFVERLLQKVNVQFLQFHGEESDSFCRQFNRPFIKTLAATSAVEILEEARRYPSACALLLDTPSVLRGGSGLAFDWEAVPRTLPKPLILAGGLTAQNVQEGIRVCAPFAVDVCSGIEASKGVKSPVKMQEFVKTMWGA